MLIKLFFECGEHRRDRTGHFPQAHQRCRFCPATGGWLDQLLRLYGERRLPVDVGVARRWGQLSAAIGHDGADLLIAATALERGLTVVTRNLRHFTPTGVAIINPWHEERDC